MIKETEQLRNHLSEAEDETVRLKTEEARVSSSQPAKSLKSNTGGGSFC